MDTAYAHTGQDTASDTAYELEHRYRQGVWADTVICSDTDMLSYRLLG